MGVSGADFPSRSAVKSLPPSALVAPHRHAVSDPRVAEASPVGLLLETMEWAIVPGLKEFLYRGVFPDGLLEGMRDLHSGLMREASSWARFKRLDQKQLRTATKPVFDHIREIFEKALITKASLDAWADTLGPLASFYFDLTALAQDVWNRARVDPIIQQMAVIGDPQYRDRHAAEWHTPLAPLRPMSPSAIVSVSRAISTMKILMTRRVTPADMPAVAPLIDMITRPRTMNTSSRQLLDDQLMIDICRSPQPFVEAVMSLFGVPGGNNDPVLECSQFVLPILNFCQSFSPVLDASVTLRNMRTTTAPHSFSIMLPVDSRNVIEFFTGSPYIWFGTILGTLERANALLDTFVLQAAPLAAGAGGNRIRTGLTTDELAGFGRAVGLVLRMNGSVERLGFTYRFVNVIHSMDLSSESLETAESIYHFNKGAVDLLGVLGFAVFDFFDLENHFGITDSVLW